MTHQPILDKATEPCFNGSMTTTNEFTARMAAKVLAMTDDQLAEALATTTSQGAWLDMLVNEDSERRIDASERRIYKLTQRTANQGG